MKTCSLFGRMLPVLAVLLLLPAAQTVLRAAVPSAPLNLSVAMAHESWEPDNPERDPNVAYRTTLTWQAPESGGEVRYRVYYRQVVPEETATSVLAEASATELVVSDYIPAEDLSNKAFSFYVTAFNNDGESEGSNPVSTACGRTFNGGDIAEYNGDGGSRIMSRPPLAAVADREYVYDASVLADYSAHDGSRVTFRLLRAPEGMTLDAEEGILRWTPREAGRFFITLSASLGDIQDSDIQSWAVDVTGESVTDVRESYGMDRNARLYPNPAGSSLNISFRSTGGAVELSVYNLHGTVLLSRGIESTAGLNTLSLETAQLAAGAYFLRISSDESVQTLPFSVAR